MRKGLLHKICTLTVAVSTMFLGYSCQQEEFFYTPENACVSFQNAPSLAYELNGDPITVKVMRGISNTEETVNINFNADEIYSIDATSVKFAVGETSKTVTISYETEGLKAFTEYAFELSFDKNLADAIELLK